MKVYLSEHIAPSAYDRLAKSFEIVDNFDHPEELDAIIVRRSCVTRQIIEKALKLKVISMHGVTRDTIDMEAAEEYHIPVPNVPGQSSQSVAELAAAFILALSRQLKMVGIGLCEGRFDHFGDTRFVTREIFGKTLGLVGTGNVARHLADIMSGGFHMKLLCYNPHRTREECARMGFEQIDSLEELFAKSDYVNLSTSLTEETENMINAKVFAAANPGLILVNTSRGGIVNEADLYTALTTGQIRAAASDVFAEEPPEKDSPLLHLENFIATFHIGGSTEEALNRVSNIAVDHVFEYTGVAPR